LQPTDAQRIAENAKKYYSRFKDSGIKTEERTFAQVESLINDVQKLDFTQQEAILNELGITVIWYDEHTEIPSILANITAVETTRERLAESSHELDSIPPSTCPRWG
jgi:hypothetical protein